MVMVPLLMSGSWRRLGMVAAAGLLALAVASSSSANPALWQLEWPHTDFSKHSVPLNEIFSGGVPKDGIPPIDHPRFAPIAEVGHLYKGTEPVISVAINGAAKAYPLGILMTHEIVNDTLGGTAIAVTYCPLCNAAIVFDRTIAGTVYDFGVSGKLRNSDLVMWDRQSESWWQQFTGEAIVGALTGTQLTMLPVRVESLDRFKARFPDGLVLRDPRGSAGFNPYAGYDSAAQPFLYRGTFPAGLRPLDYVLAVAGEAWTLDLLMREKRIERDGLIITWQPGQNAAMDKSDISQGRDIGNVTVQRRQGDTLVDVVHDVTFAFAFHAFNPDAPIHK